ncbi:MAG: oligoribonuclease, partial [Gammaproteobacteria bacterium]|nr:oligoribonuclease [Gammaproteobacteria bacterium]
MADDKNKRLIWIDLEMTGLDTVNDTIIEIATIVTDGELNILAEGPVCAVKQDEEVLKAMDEWNRSHHTDSGLWQRVKFSPHDMASAEATTIAFLDQWVNKGSSPMCG